MSAVEELGDFAFGLRLEEVPPDVAQIAKSHLLDTIGVGLAGAESVGARAARGLALEMGGAGRASGWGGPQELSAVAAAMVNGASAHALDFDDGHSTTVIHPSASLVPALLAQAEASGSDGSTFLAALVGAYEVVLRLGMAQFDPELGNSAFFERGLHATSILGAVAAAAPVARLRGLTAGQAVDAMSVACSFGAGIIEANRAGGTVKQVHCGWAANAAVSAAALTAHGLSGPRTALEGRFGLFPALCGAGWTPGELTRGLGTVWLSREMGLKPYPCNMFTHSVIDAAVALRQEGLDPDTVAKVEIGTAAASARTIGEPLEEKRHPQSPYHAAFSAPYVFASALLGGRGLGISTEDFTDVALADPRRIALAERCTVVADQECTRLFPRQMAAVVTVQLRDGSRRRQWVGVPRGSAERPLTDEELAGKLRSTAGWRAGALAEAVGSLDAASDLDGLARAWA